MVYHNISVKWVILLAFLLGAALSYLNFRTTSMVSFLDETDKAWQPEIQTTTGSATTTTTRKHQSKPIYRIKVPRIPEVAEECFLLRPIPTKRYANYTGYVALDFEWCTDDNCPTKESPPDILPAEWKYVLSCPDENLTNVTAILLNERQIRFEAIEIYTGQLTKGHFFVKDCLNVPTRLCHEPCPYPRFRDLFDNACKSSDPRALDPIRQYGGACEFHHTCFTPQANDPDSSWPWESEAQRYEFYRSNVSGAAREAPPFKCRRERRKQPLTFNFEQSTACAAARGEANLTLSCGDQWAFQHHLIFMPKAKLVFCGVPKNGITEWLRFFRYMIGANDYLSWPHHKKDLYEFHMTRLPAEKAAEILSDPTWTKAVVFRDPADRLLSAYLNKVATRKAGFDGYSSDFAELVNNLASGNEDCKKVGHGVHRCSDPHFAAQVHSCALDSHLPLYTFIGSLDYAAEHTRALLERTNSWDTFGKRYESRALLKGLPYAIPVPVDNDTTGFNQDGPPSDVHMHSEKAKEKMDKYYTPELLEKVRKAYAMDYEVWDALNAEPGKFISGRDLDVVKNTCKL